MSTQPTVPTPADLAATSPAPSVPAAPAPTPTEPAAAAPVAPKQPEQPAANVWDSPESAKAEIERLRRENGAARTNAKQQAADEARTQLATDIGKALGLVKDEPADPVKLTEQLTQQTEAAKRAQVELAVFKNAGAAGADPQALLDSASFLAKAATLDPSDAAGIAMAITEAVQANPRLAAAPTSRVPAPDPAQGTSGGGAGGTTQITKEQLATMSPADIDKAFNEGRLSQVLGSAKP